VIDVVFPDPVPLPSITLPNPKWNEAVIDIARQLASATGAAFAGPDEFLEARRLLGDRLLGQGDE
jgi:CRISPR/Cas system-associated protein Csm6